IRIPLSCGIRPSVMYIENFLPSFFVIFIPYRIYYKANYYYVKYSICQETLKMFPLPIAGEGQGEGVTRKSILFTLT
ncbi:MAG: hypothetical protein JSU79_03605, partial [Dehalococcoidales bacterium]